ncbi:Recombination protein N [Piscirickettsia salmonis]|uniref:DNA repair protein RecN n=1 Tax=Piscirickettsia salmonis TaxID=1238 RepID=UPI0012B70867|nr:DNA repair protein RecN [Piscirickettsia salmonis]QGO65394.1 Recombination protein N [Piscirickettsia salmonis]
MLTQLFLRHFATIEHAEINLNQGLTVLTGETGAGKSILMNATHLLLGGRANTQFIRTGAKRAEIQATLRLATQSNAHTWLKQQELELDLDSDVGAGVDPGVNDHKATENIEYQECIIRRTLSSDGRSQVYINGRRTSLHNLQHFAQHCFQIQGQHEAYSLKSEDKQRELLDAYGNHFTQLTQVKTHYHVYKQTHEQLQRIQKLHDAEQAEFTLLEYQIAELEELNLEADEVELLNNEHKTLHQHDSLKTECYQALEHLSGDRNVISQLESLESRLNYLAEHHPKGNDICEYIKQAHIQLNEANTELQQLSGYFEPDEERLQHIEKRLDKIHSTARKHKVEAHELYNTWLHLQEKFQHNHDRQNELDQLKKKRALQEQDYQAAAKQLSTSRQQSALALSQKITQLIRTLGLTHAVFSIDLSSDSNMISGHGQDKITMLIQTNPGLDQGPLHSIASGGELSRIALALQVICAEKMQPATLIFDEADTGISGSTAEVVGQLLRTLGEHCQILCITHLPQVAALGHHHIRVSKQTSNQSTNTAFDTLNQEQRIQELARILGGVHITATTLAHAKELICA